MSENKYCYEGYAFQHQLDILLKGIGRLQDEIEEHDREMDSKRKEVKTMLLKVKTMAYKGDCEKCQHKLECITNNKEVINVKVEPGW